VPTFFEIIYLYSPLILLALLIPVKAKLNTSGENVAGQSISLFPSMIFIFFLLSNFIVQAIWFNANLLKDSYSAITWEAFILFWNALILMIIMVVSKSFKIKLSIIINPRKTYYQKMLIIGLIALCTILLLTKIFEAAELNKNIQKGSFLPEILKNRSLFLLFGFNSIILIPLVEEIVFRGFLYTAISQKIGRIGGFIFSSYIFMHSHFGTLQSSLMRSIIILFVGLFLAWLYDRKQTLIYPIGFHALFNFWSVYLKL